MDLYRLAYWLEDLIPGIVEWDGYLFIDRGGLGIDGIQAKVATYSSVAEAQSWMNIVLLDEFISEAVGSEWKADDPSVGTILSIFEQVWSYHVKAAFPNACFTVEKLIDEDSGDVGLRLLSALSPGIAPNDIANFSIPR